MKLIGFETPTGRQYVNPEHVVSVRPSRSAPGIRIWTSEGGSVLVSTPGRTVDDIARILVDPTDPLSPGDW